MHNSQWKPEPGSFLVAISRWGSDLEQELPFLASLLGVTAYDLRMRIMALPPVVLVRNISEFSAFELIDLLRKRGHKVVFCDRAELRASSEMFRPRDFSFSPNVLTLSENEQSPGTIVAYDQISALVLAKQAVAVLGEEQKTKKKFSATRAIATGGLVRSKKVKMQLRSEQAERESVLYMYCDTEPKEIFFQESMLHYKGLGELMGPTRQKNFATFTQLIRHKCPDALFDESMFKHLRKTSFAASSGVIKTSTTVHSNASQNDLAAWLIVLAHLDTQP